MYLPKRYILKNKEAYAILKFIFNLCFEILVLGGAKTDSGAASVQCKLGCLCTRIWQPFSRVLDWYILLQTISLNADIT